MSDLNSDLSALRDQRVLVTGASGFLGTHLLRRLTGSGVWVFCLTLPGEPPTSQWPDRCILLPVDVRDRSGVFQAFDWTRPDIVFHLAAVGVTQPEIEPERAMAVNVEGTVNILEACRHVRTRRMVHVGTSFEYCDPTNAYIASKRAAWAFVQGYARSEQLPVVCLRLFHAYGPSQPAKALIAGAILAAIKEQDFEMTPGAQWRDLIYVDDLVDGMVRSAVQPGIESMTLDLGTGREHQVAYVVRRIYAMTDSKGIPKVGAVPYRPSEVMRLLADAERTEGLLNWRCQVDLDAGLAKTIQWYRDQTSHGGCAGVV